MPKSGEDLPLQAMVVKTRSVGEYNLVGGSERLDSPCQDAGKCVGVEDKAQPSGPCEYSSSCGGDAKEFMADGRICL